MALSFTLCQPDGTIIKGPKHGVDIAPDAIYCVIRDYLSTGVSNDKVDLYGEGEFAPSEMPLFLRELEKGLAEMAQRPEEWQVEVARQLQNGNFVPVFESVRRSDVIKILEELKDLATQAVRREVGLSYLGD